MTGYLLVRRADVAGLASLGNKRPPQDGGTPALVAAGSNSKSGEEPVKLFWKIGFNSVVLCS